jgi:hypothetical protein
LTDDEPFASAFALALGMAVFSFAAGWFGQGLFGLL